MSNDSDKAQSKTRSIIHELVKIFSSSFLSMYWPNKSTAIHAGSLSTNTSLLVLFLQGLWLPHSGLQVQDTIGCYLMATDICPPKTAHPTHTQCFLRKQESDDLSANKQKHSESSMGDGAQVNMWLWVWWSLSVRIYKLLNAQIFGIVGSKSLSIES